MYFYVIQTVFKPFKNHKNQRSQIMLDFILSVIYNYIFLCYLDCFQIFKNHKNQRSQIVLNFILKILQSAKYQTGSIFFQLKISQLYIIMYFYKIQTVFKPFKNHKNQRSQIMLDFILKIYKNQTGSIFFHLKIAQLYIIMYFYIIYSVFKLFKNNKNQRSDCVEFHIDYNLLDQYFFTSKQLSNI